MLQVYLENLFNRVRHDGRFKELMHVGLNVIVEGVKMAHQSCSTGLITSRKLTTSIPVESFVRQGCLLSRPSCMRCTCSPIVCVLRAARFFVGLNWIRWSETVSLRGWRDWFLHRSPKLRRLNYWRRNFVKSRARQWIGTKLAASFMAWGTCARVLRRCTVKQRPFKLPWRSTATSYKHHRILVRICQQSEKEYYQGSKKGLDGFLLGQVYVMSSLPQNCPA